MRAPLLLALVLLGSAPAWAAEEPSGCDKFKWNIDHERAALTAPDRIKLASGGDVAAVPSTGMTLALLAPANMDKALVDRLYAAAQDATKDPKVRALFAEQGAQPTDLGPEDLKKFMASEISKWSEVIAKMGIAPM